MNNVTTTSYFVTFLQIVYVANSYWFLLMPIFGKRAQWQKKPNNMKKGWRKKIAKYKPLSLNVRNNGPQAHKITKWLQRKQTGQGSSKEWSSKPMGIMRNRKKAKKGAEEPKEKNWKMGLVWRPINPKEKDVAIGSGEPKEISNSPWECKKEGKNEMGWGCPKE